MEPNLAGGHAETLTRCVGVFHRTVPVAERNQPIALYEPLGMRLGRGVFLCDVSRQLTTSKLSRGQGPRDEYALLFALLESWRQLGPQKAEVDGGRLNRGDPGRCRTDAGTKISAPEKAHKGGESQK